MTDPTELGGPDYRAYCFLNSERQCRGDCVSFDPNGARDTSGKLTSCRLLNDLAGLRAASVTVGTYFRSNTSPPGTNVPPPRAFGG